ncbi:MAG: anaerobic ribonucleoside-triphosphate reductase activating protein [Spirochaetaceae bacterium]|nr:anaerobic ribonucleoside-triphosphate reductase activating protein [Spirochaetaceae bacterium]
MNLNIKTALLKTSFNDYPGKIASVIFFTPCNLRCPWCHNGALINGAQNEELLPLSEALVFIEKRAKLIGGVVLSGGEPTLYKDLGELITRIKSLGLLCKLDTNGLRPDVLKNLIGGSAQPDFFAMDLKLAPNRYKFLLPPAAQKTIDTGELVSKLAESARIIRESGSDYEFRSLVFSEAARAFSPDYGGQPSEKAAGTEAGCAPPFFGEDDIEALRTLAEPDHWHIRGFIGGNCLDERWNNLPRTEESEAARLSKVVQAGRGAVNMG